MVDGFFSGDEEEITEEEDEAGRDVGLAMLEETVWGSVAASSVLMGTTIIRIL